MGTKKWLILFGVIAVTIFSGCAGHCIKIPTKNNTESEVKFFYNITIGNNGYETYICHVVITNYHQHKLLGSDLLSIAKKYIDTATTDKAISAVAFIGQEVNSCIPDPDWKESETGKVTIIEFVFDNAFRENANKKNIGLDAIRIWKGRESTIIYKNNPKFNSLLDAYY